MFDATDARVRLREAQARLSVTLGPLTDADARRPSRLPGWTVGHLLTHVARNADSAVRRLEGAERGLVVDQYVGGAEGRAAEIEAGARRSMQILRDDVSSSGARVEAVVARLGREVWDRPTRGVDGDTQSAAQVLLGRIREVEMHHVDLGLAAYGPADWPAGFVSAQLADELPALADRAGPAALLAWLTGRGPAPELPPWR